MMTVGELILSIPEEIKEEVFRNFEFVFFISEWQ